ncbi:UNVERIFIED_CONTAM: hypothetical protein PYX00_011727 [Menopon gallinae]|uniref:Uncharacterized protein n=1 Tax=Menopon gallinae TaxID=328185 RepID=A0AAW2H8G9_9NEOP
MKKDEVTLSFVYKDIWKRYVLGISSLKLSLVPILFLIVVSAFTETRASSYSGQLTSSIKDRTGITKSLLRFLATSFVCAVSSELYGIILSRSLQKVYVYSLRDSLAKYILLDFLSFREMGVGKILGIMERRSQSLGEFVSVVINHLTPMPFFFVFLSYRIQQDLGWSIVLAVYVFIAIYLASTVAITNYRSRLRREVNEKSNFLNNMANEILSNYEVIKAFNNEEYEIRRYDRKSRELIRPTVKLWRGLYILNMVQKVILFFMDATILLLLVYRNDAKIEPITQYISHSNSIKKKLYNLGSLYGTFKLSMTNIKSTYVVPAEVDRAQPLNTPPLDAFRDKIVFRDVSLWQRGLPIVSSLNFEFHKNEKIAIVGTNGSGKTTFVRMLLGFYDYKGSIKIDSVELRDIPKRDLRNLISFVPQDSALMNETIRENIVYGSQKDDKDVIRVSSRYGVHDSFLRLKDAYMTVAGDRGKNLSGGERQKVALARAALRDRDIYILDEPTASIDSVSEIKIFKRLLSPANKRTVFVIVHNLDLIVYSDKVLYFNNGTATLYGSCNEFWKHHRNQIDFYNQNVLSTESLPHTTQNWKRIMKTNHYPIMLVYLGLPSREQALPRSTRVCTQVIGARDLRCKSLDSIVLCTDKLSDLEKRCLVLMSSMYQSFKSYCYEAYSCSTVPRSHKSFEKSVMEAGRHMELCNNAETVEALISLLAGELSRTEELCLDRVQYYSGIIKRYERLRDKASGSLAEISLNVVAKREEEHEFLMPFFVVIPKNTHDALAKIVMENERIASSTVEHVCSDENYELFKFYGMKSAEASIRKLMQQSGFVLKTFDDDDEFSKNMEEVGTNKETERCFSAFMEEQISHIFRLYSSLKVARVYLDCFLMYGLPAKYTILCVQGKREKDVVKYARELAACYGLYHSDADALPPAASGSVFSSLDLAVREAVFHLMEDQ